MGWVTTRSVEAPRELWTAGLQLYLQHANQIRRDYADILGEPTNTTSPSTTLQPEVAPTSVPSRAISTQGPTKPFFSFGAAPPLTNGDQATRNPASTPPKPAFNFSALAKANDTSKPATTSPSIQPAPAFNFGGGSATTLTPNSNTPSKTAPLFSFGAKAVDAATDHAAKTTIATSSGGQKPLFSFGGGAAASPFSFNNTGGGGSPFSLTAPAVKAAEDDGAEAEEEDPEPPVKRPMMEVEPEDEDNRVVFTAKAKYFLRSSEGEWSGIGVGLLTVKQPKAEGSRPFIVFRKIDGGKVLLRASIQVRGVKGWRE